MTVLSYCQEILTLVLRLTASVAALEVQVTQMQQQLTTLQETCDEILDAVEVHDPVAFQMGFRVN